MPPSPGAAAGPRRGPCPGAAGRPPLPPLRHSPGGRPETRGGAARHGPARPGPALPCPAAAALPGPGPAPPPPLLPRRGRKAAGPSAPRRSPRPPRLARCPRRERRSRPPPRDMRGGPAPAPAHLWSPRGTALLEVKGSLSRGRRPSSPRGRARRARTLVRRKKEKVGRRGAGAASAVAGGRHAAAHLPAAGYRGFSSGHLSPAPSLLRKCQTPLTATSAARSAAVALLSVKRK